MSLFKCKNCGKEKELLRQTIIIINNKLVTKESLCECGEYMTEKDKSFKGFPQIIRNEPNLRK